MSPREEPNEDERKEDERGVAFGAGAMGSRHAGSPATGRRPPLRWIPDEPTSTHVINVLHLLLSAGERWFVKVFREGTLLVRDPELLKDVAGFVEQEATHSVQHGHVLNHLAAQRLDTTDFTRHVGFLSDRTRSDEICWPCCAGTARRRSSTAQSPSTCSSTAAAAASPRHARRAGMAVTAPVTLAMWAWGAAYLIRTTRSSPGTFATASRRTTGS